MTPFSDKCDIIASVYVGYVNSPQWKEFFFFNSIGLPLAYMITTKMATATTEGRFFIEETWENLCNALGADKDGTYKTVSDLDES